MSDVPTGQEIDKVLRSYLREGRLMTMPRPGRKREIVLERIVQRFEPGERYPEADVNAILSAVWDDVAALRRYLVEAGLLERADGRYWRIGGQVEV